MKLSGHFGCHFRRLIKLNHFQRVITREERSCETAAVEVSSVNDHTYILLVLSTCRLKSTIHFLVIDLRSEKVNLRNHEALNDIFA